MASFGFPGQPGAHSEGAIRDFLHNIRAPSYPTHPKFASTDPSSIRTAPCASVDVLLDRLALPSSDPNFLHFAMVPIENTCSGTFTHHYDLLLDYYKKVHVVAEWIVHERNVLAVSSASGISDAAQIEVVYSHPHVFHHCKTIMDDIKKGTVFKRQVGVEDTAEAAAIVKQTSEKAAVLCSAEAARLNGLMVLKKGSAVDDGKSFTRYLILSGTPLTNEQLSAASQVCTLKTSLAVSLKNQPGALVKVLSSFSYRDVNVSKIESRPSSCNLSSRLIQHAQPWEYINFLDVEGGTCEEIVRKALANVEEFATGVKVFGSYPRFAGVTNPDAAPLSPFNM